MEALENNVKQTLQDYINYVVELMNKGVKVSHITKGGIYTISGFTKMKSIEDGSWHTAVIYTNSNKETFVRDISSFVDNFIEIDTKSTNCAIKHIKNVRVELNTIIDDSKIVHKSKEIDLAITKLKEARMWFGEELRRLGDKYPYPNSINPNNVIIDPQADTKYGSDYDVDKSKLTPP